MSVITIAKRLSLVGIVASIFTKNVIADDLSLLDLTFTQTYANSAMQATELPGESISLLDRRVDWNVSDIVLQGAGPLIEVSRRNAVRGYGWYDQWRRDLYNWELSIPKIELHLWVNNEDNHLNNIVTGSCGNNGGYGKIKNLEVKINGIGEFRTIGHNTNVIYPNETYLHFNNNWLLKCGQSISTRSNSTDSEGHSLPSVVVNGIVLLSPEGDTYYFAYSSLENQILPPAPPKDSQSIAWLEWNRLTQRISSFYLTDIEDRFGNYVTYHYERRPDNNDGTVLRVQRITASDGREVNFEYQVDNHGQTGIPGSGRHLKRVTAGSQSVDYTYTTGDKGQPILHKASYPGQLSWEYSYYPFNNLDMLKQVKTPWGSSVNYEYATLESPPNACRDLNAGAAPAVKSRVVQTGLGQFNYQYRSFNSSIGSQATWVTEVTEPDAKKQFYHACYNIWNTAANNPDRAKQFSLLRQQVYGGANKNILQRSVDTEWGTAEYNGTVLRQRQGDSFRSALRLFKTKETVIQNGDVHTTQYSDFDELGLSRTIHKFSNLGYGNRYQRQHYYHDTAHWLLGLPTTTALSDNGSNWTTVSEQTYYASSHTYKSLPYQFYRFGILQSTNNSYHNDGYLKLKTFNLENRWVEYSNYKRGKPQLEKHPQRYASGCNNPDSCFISASRVINNDGSTTRITDFNGRRTDYQYDNLLRVTRITPADTRWAPTVITYPLESGRLTQQISQGNYRKKINYDGLLRPVLTQEWDATSPSATSRYTVQRFNADNQPVFTSYASASSTESSGTVFEYDGLKRLTRQYSNVDNTGNTYRYLYGNRVQAEDALGNITETTYQAYGSPSQELPVRIVQPEGVITTLSYNLFDNLTAITQGGVTESRFYNAQQRLCRIVRPDVGHAVYSYNALGQVQWSALGASGGAAACNESAVTAAQKITHSYDNLGQLQTLSYGDSTPEKSYHYDNQGNLLQISAGNSVWDYQYNSAHLMDSEILTVDNISRIIEWQYDALGHVSGQLYPSGKQVSFAPNALGQPTRVGNYVTNAVYYPNGQLSRFTYGNGLSFTQTLDSQQRPEYQTVAQSNTALLSHRYRYDANHNIETINDLVSPAKNISLGYDNLNRLASASGFWGSGSFGYDELGNITRKTLGNQNLNYSYNTSNRLAGITGSVNRSYSYDSRGNVTNNGQRTFTYNLANQLISSGPLSYQYDGYNRRVKKTNGATTEYSLYSAAGQLLMTDGSNGPTEYFYLGNKLIAKESQVKTAEDTPGYTGHLEDDDLQLTYMQQRYYDPLAARFNSNDPVGFSADKPMMFNRYAYANNNPYTYIDPDGRETTRFSIRTDERIERFAQGKLSEKEFLDEAKAEGAGALVGLAVVSPVDELTVAGAIAGKVISGASKVLKGVDKAADRPGNIPSDWLSKKSKKGDGTQYINPNNQHDRVRVMPGNPNSPNPAQQVPYVKRQIDGKFYDANGLQVSGDSLEAHIPLDKFKF